MNEIIPIAQDLSGAAPAPLAPLTNTIIDPANIAIQARRKQAVRLTRRELADIRQQLKQIERELNRRQYHEIVAIRASTKDTLAQYRAAWVALQEQINAAPDDESLKIQQRELLDEAEPIRAQWQQINQQARQIIPLVELHENLSRGLENHLIAVERDKAEQRLFLAMQREAKVYERLIIDKWTRLGYCHRYTDGQYTRTDKVHFSEVGITLDSIYYKIATSFQTIFKKWKTEIPDHVRITTQLLDPVTLDELSIVCQRQVTGVHSPAGAWVIVHRLDSVDGLMNFVAYGDVMERFPAAIADRIPICVGVGLNREIKWITLSEFPHWLIGGFTGSGKSNLVNVGICTMISRQKPTELRLILIDLKGGLEFDTYKGLPHLHGDIVDSVEKVAECLAEIESIMHERFKAFRGVARKYEEYRARKPHDYMPRLLIVFDEVASIMEHGDTTKRILASLREITRMGRAVGVHVWLCTQRPDVEAIAGSVKANLAVRISGRMTTSQDSITVLGSSAAKDLAPVKGRMVLQIGPDPEPVQTPRITEDDITDALKIALAFPAPPPLDVPENARVVHQEWTPERVIELSIKHLNGNVTYKKVYEAAEGLSQSQARALVERIWNMGEVEFEGKRYQVKSGRSNTRHLVEITQESESLEFKAVSIAESTSEPMPEAKGVVNE